MVCDGENAHICSFRSYPGNLVPKFRITRCHKESWSDGCETHSQPNTNTKPAKVHLDLTRISPQVKIRLPLFEELKSKHKPQRKTDGIAE
jgi:hypothetical protein